MTAQRQMRLTERHVALCNRDIPDPGPQLVEGYRIATDADYGVAVAGMLAARPPGPFWLFGYGSLIWKPETAFQEQKMGVARGWHRRFCLGWDYRYRGSRDAPGLMMALDRGGQCKGMLYRLPEAGLEAELHKLIRREMSMVPSAFPWRFIEVVTLDGRVRALTFAMNRKSPRYVSDIDHEHLAEVLAKACGFRGSMAEYLFQTVSKLESLGIHDKTLWRMQKLVAARIDAAFPGGAR
jgi:cation transport protein ChaC